LPPVLSDEAESSSDPAAGTPVLMRQGQKDEDRLKRILIQIRVLYMADCGELKEMIIPIERLEAILASLESGDLEDFEYSYGGEHWEKIVRDVETTSPALAKFLMEPDWALPSLARKIRCKHRSPLCGPFFLFLRLCRMLDIYQIQMLLQRLVFIGGQIFIILFDEIPYILIVYRHLERKSLLIEWVVGRHPKLPVGDPLLLDYDV
jgi:hypothetical protein